MEPRLSTSRKWSPLPKELLEQIRSVFKQNFKDQIGQGTVEADGKIFPTEILVAVGFKEGSALKQSNFAISIAYKRDKDNVLKLLHLAVDAAASLFEQFFAAENDHDFPRIWEEIDFEGRKVFIRYDTTNSQLEVEANRLLGDKFDADEVVQGDWEADEELTPEQIKATLGIDPDEGEEAPAPPPKKKQH
jgi:hypothetical protein